MYARLDSSKIHIKLDMLLQDLRVSNLQLSHIVCFVHSYRGKELHGERRSEAVPSQRAHFAQSDGRLAD